MGKGPKNYPLFSKNERMKKLIIVLLFFGATSIMNGQEASPNVLSSGAEFLRISPDARSSSVGNSGIGFAEDVSALHYNSASIVFFDKSIEVGGSYSSWLKSMGVSDVFFGHIGGYVQLPHNQAAGLQLKYFSMGNVIYKDSYGMEINSSQPKEMELSISYIRKLGKSFSVGVTPKYIHSSIGSGMVSNGYTLKVARAFATDISLATQFGIGEKVNLNAGLTLSNIGSKLRYANIGETSYLPANLGLGVGWKYKISDKQLIRFGGDINKLMVPTPVADRYFDEMHNEVVNPAFDQDNNGVADFKEYGVVKSIFVSFNDASIQEELKEIGWSIGGEYVYGGVLALRCGYHHESLLKGGRRYFSTGVGVNYEQVVFNISYWSNMSAATSGPLNNTLRFSVLYVLGKSIEI